MNRLRSLPVLLDFQSAILNPPTSSRWLFSVHWEIREQMTEMDVEIILQRAKEHFSEARPRIISDNGPQFIAKNFKEFIPISGMTHMRTSPYYPQSNGKLERFHATIKGECIRPGVPLSLDDARRMVEGFIHHYNNVRLHSAIGYIAPVDKLNGRDQEIFKERDRKLEKAREQRKKKRLRAYGLVNPKGDNTPPPNPLMQTA